jgi:GT2 family glycosyltransferase
VGEAGVQGQRGLVSVIIVNWNGARHLPVCLQSLRDQTWTPREVLVVDNDSRDESREVIAAHPEVRLLPLDRNVGFAAGNNAALAEVRGEFVALLNNDAAAEPRWLETCVGALHGRPEVAAVGCVVRRWTNGAAPFDGDAPIDTSWVKIDPRSGAPFNFNDERPQGPNDYLAGCAMVVRREVVERIGMLDAAYEAYFEETDWSARMIRGGYTLLFTPATQVWHRVQASSRERAEHYNEWMMCRNRVRFVLKNFDALFLGGFLALYLREIALEVWRGSAGARADDPVGKVGRRRRARLLVRALRWNLRRLPETLAARRRDLGRIDAPRSYNRNLPLRHVPPNR